MGNGKKPELVGDGAVEGEVAGWDRDEEVFSEISVGISSVSDESPETLEA